MLAKIVFNSEIKLIKLDFDQFSKLQQDLPSYFKTQLPEFYNLTFTDPSNDEITITTYEDLQLLEQLYKSPLKISIKEIQIPEPKKKTNEMEEEISYLIEKKLQESFIKEEKKIVHSTVKCDGCCIKPIPGTRYKCSICPNFDFCEKCEKEIKHPNHAFLKIRDMETELPNIKDSKKMPFEQFNPHVLFDIAQPFIQNISEACKRKCEQKEKENPCGEQDFNEKIKEKAEKLKDIIGVTLEEGIEIIKTFGLHKKIEEIVAVLLGDQKN